MSDILSPGVYVSEKDLTFNITNIVANVSGYAGLFRWGPVEQPVRITSNESELVRRFGQPDKTTSLYFHSALNYLLYTNPLIVVRAVDSDVALNAVPAESGVTPILVKNDDQYEDAVVTGISFIGRYPGQLGNSLSISMADNTDYANWEYADEFDYVPAAGEFNMVVVDEDGLITGQAGTILETYELMTLTAGDKKTDGTTAYIGTALRNQSNWVLLGDTDAITFDGVSGTYEVSLTGGVDGNDAVNADWATAWATFNNSETVEIMRVFTSGTPATAVTGVIDIMDSRGDSIAFVAPELSDVYNAASPEVNIKEYFTTTINKNTSYAFYVDNWKLVNDKYNDQTIWIPTDSDAAALHARTFAQTEAWFSPAGFNRGQLKNVIKLAWNANKPQRDVLYKNAVNSIVAFPGEGTVLYGDKTALQRPSAFSRINVRTLFIVLKKNIANAAKYQLFEINDEITRSVFRNAVNAYLENVQGRRGLTDYRVIADETNNTPSRIDANEFIGDIFLKPARTINFIKLSFIAVATGVDFEEVENA